MELPAYVLAEIDRLTSLFDKAYPDVDKPDEGRPSMGFVVGTAYSTQQHEYCVNLVSAKLIELILMEAGETDLGEIQWRIRPTLKLTDDGMLFARARVWMK